MDRPGPSIGWLVALGGVATLALLAVLPPVIGGGAGHAVHQLFSAVCHQLPDRTPHLGGGPIALCHRCSGILAGFLVGVAMVPAVPAAVVGRIVRGAQVWWLAVALLPTAVDWALGALDVWANTPVSRTVTGAVFGLVAGGILGANLLVSPQTSSTPPLSDAR